MKKFLLIVLSVLLVVALVSCKQGISEEDAEKLAEERAEKRVNEAAENYKEFTRYRYILEHLIGRNFTMSGMPDSPWDEVAIPKDNQIDPEDFVETWFGSENELIHSEYNSTTLEKAGKCSGTDSGYGIIDVTYKDIEIKATYTVYDRKTRKELKKVTDEAVTISAGTYKVEKKSETVYEYSMSATINGTEYSLAYTLEYSESREDWNFTSAGVNGKKLTPKFLDALKLENSEYYNG